MPELERFSVLLVCSGNICRSPTAEGVLRQMVKAAGLEPYVDVSSAGTHGLHAGEAPDPRARSLASRRGYDISMIRARKVTAADLARFDLVLGMADEHVEELNRLSAEAYRERIRLYLDFAEDTDELEVPDPYYGGPAAFDRAFDLIEHGAQGLLEHLRWELERRGVELP